MFISNAEVTKRYWNDFETKNKLFIWAIFLIMYAIMRCLSGFFPPPLKSSVCRELRILALVFEVLLFGSCLSVHHWSAKEHVSLWDNWYRNSIFEWIWVACSCSPEHESQFNRRRPRPGSGNNAVRTDSW